jgi:hypothetical protein
MQAVIMELDASAEVIASQAKASASGGGGGVWGAGGYASTQGQVDILIGVDMNSQPTDPAYSLCVRGHGSCIDSSGAANECSHRMSFGSVMADVQAGHEPEYTHINRYIALYIAWRTRTLVTSLHACRTSTEVRGRCSAFRLPKTLLSISPSNSLLSTVRIFICPHFHELSSTLCIR